MTTLLENAGVYSRVKTILKLILKLCFVLKLRLFKTSFVRILKLCFVLRVRLKQHIASVFQGHGSGPKCLFLQGPAARAPRPRPQSVLITVAKRLVCGSD